MAKSNHHIHSIAIVGEWGSSTHFSALDVCHGLGLTWCGRPLGALSRMYGSRIGVESYVCVSSTMDSFSSLPRSGVSLARVPSSVDVFFRPRTSPPSSVALFRPSDRVSWTISPRFVRHGLGSYPSIVDQVGGPRSFHPRSTTPSDPEWRVEEQMGKTRPDWSKPLGRISPGRPPLQAMPSNQNRIERRVE